MLRSVLSKPFGRPLCMSLLNRWALPFALVLLAGLLVPWSRAAEPSKEAASAAKAKPAAPAVDAETKDQKKADEKKAAKDPHAWKPMFDGKSLKGWKVPQFGGEGEVKVEKGVISLAMGDPMTGIKWTGELPRYNYEFRMEARRTMGIDFFATTTFPYGEETLSLVVGGWAGSVVGLSCVDYYDASDNVSTKFMAFKDKQWYRVRIRVTKQRIEAWIDNEKMIDQGTKGHKFTIRDEVELCQPFGICTWCTGAEYRKLEMRKLTAEEVAEIPVRDRWD